MNEDESCQEEKAGARKTIHLNDCLRLFTVEETLGVDDEWWALIRDIVHCIIIVEMLRLSVVILFRHHCV